MCFALAGTHAVPQYPTLVAIYRSCINPFRFCPKNYVAFQDSFAVGVTRDNKQMFKQAIPTVEKAIKLTYLDSYAKNTTKDLEAAYPKQ